MISVSKKARVRLGLIAVTAATGLVLAGCAGGGGGGGDEDNTILIGTTDKVTTLDPAGSYDNGSLALQTQACDQVDPDISFIKSLPAIESLRGDPAFQALLRRIGLG